MKGKLIRYEDSLALVLDQTIVDEMNITLDTPLEVSLEDDTIKVRPSFREADPEDIKDALERVNQRYGRALKRLAE